MKLSAYQQLTIFISLLFTDQIIFILVSRNPSSLFINLLVGVSGALFLIIFILRNHLKSATLHKSILFSLILMILFSFDNYQAIKTREEILGILEKRDEFKLNLVITKKTKNSKTTCYHFIINSVETDNKKLHLRQKIRYYDYLNNIKANEGDTIVAKGALSLVSPEKNLGEFPAYKESFRNKEYFTIKNLKVVSKIKGKADFEIKSWVSKRIIEKYREVLSGKQTAWQTALTIGEKSLLKSELKEQFRLSGALHLMAVSGLHVGFVLIFLLGLNRLLNLKDIPFTILASCCLIFYGIICGWQPSVTRAVIMALLFLFSYPLNRLVSSVDVVSSAGIISLLINPGASSALGFQLSFLAVFGIIFLVPIIKSIFQTKKKKGAIQTIGGKLIITPLTVSLAVSLTLLPLILYNFGFTNFISILGNLVLIPLASISFFLGFLTLLLSFLPFTKLPALFISFYLAKVNELIFYVTSNFSKSSIFTIYHYLPLFVVIALYLLIISLIVKNRRVKTTILLCSIIMMGIVLFTKTKGQNSVFYGANNQKMAMIKGNDLRIFQNCNKSLFKYKVIHWLEKQNIKTIYYKELPFKNFKHDTNIRFIKEE